MRAGAAAAPFDQCLDADTLAAWIDGDLKAGRRRGGGGARLVLCALSVDDRGAGPRDARRSADDAVVAAAMGDRLAGAADCRRAGDRDLDRVARRRTRSEPARADARAQPAAAAGPAQEPRRPGPPASTIQSRAAIAPQESSALNDRVSTPPARDARSDG